MFYSPMIADVQADPSHRCPHMPEDPFSHGMTHTITTTTAPISCSDSRLHIASLEYQSIISTERLLNSSG